MACSANVDIESLQISQINLAINADGPKRVTSGDNVQKYIGLQISFLKYF